MEIGRVGEWEQPGERSVPVHELAVLILGEDATLRRLCAEAGVLAHAEPSPAAGLDLLQAQGFHAVLVPHTTAESAASWLALLQEREVHLPAILVLPGPDAVAESAAREAGAVACIDLSCHGPGDLERAVRFAHAQRLRWDAREAHLLDELGRLFAHEGRNALAGISGAIQVVSDHLPVGAADRVLCAEIRARLGEFARTIDALGMVLRRVPGAPRWSGLVGPELPWTREGRRGVGGITQTG